MEKSLETIGFKAFGGDKRDRTADLLNAIQALSQLSYTPIFACVCLKRKRIIADTNEKCKCFFQILRKFFEIKIKIRKILKST